MQKSWRITHASKSLEFHPGKKEIGEWVGRGDIPRLDSYYSSFSKWTTTSRTYPARHARNFGRGDPYADSSRVAPESNVGERETWWRGIDERTFAPLLRSRFRDERKKNEGRNRCEFAAGSSHTHPPNVLLSNVERSIRISMLMEGKVERWWHSRVEHFMFVNLLLRLKFTDATGR